MASPAAPDAQLKDAAAAASSSASGARPIGERVMPKDELELKKEKEADGPRKSSGSPEGIIDMDILGQVFEMDELEDEDDEEGGGGHEFSKGIVWHSFEQAGSTFDEMKQALESKDLPRLSSLGHFLKGSSAALGITKVKDSCEKMQHYGNLRDEEAGTALSETEALDRISKLLGVVEKEYQEAADWLKGYYDEKEAGGQ
jgi:osomolarity two-component system phosphorelay intermediate protein YPD1